MTDFVGSDLDIMTYLKVFFRRKEIIIISLFLGLVAGICSGFLLPKKYMSSSVILVEEGKTDNPLFSQLAVSTTVDQRLATIRESMLGWNSIKELVKRLSLDKDVKTAKQFENLILGIKDRINIKLKGRNILNISYVDDDPVTTQAVVKNITDIFIERNKAIQDEETQDAIVFIEEQLRVYKGKIKSAEIAQLTDKLDELLVDSTEKHPLVKEIREKISQKEQELRAENLEYTEPDKLEIESSNPIINSIRNALESIDAKTQAAVSQATPTDDMYNLILLDKLGSVMARDAQVNENIYNVLLQRLETAKITQRLQASKEGTKYSILDPPRVPLDPFKPNKVLVALIGLFFGAVVGFCVIFSMEFLDRSFIDVEEAKEFLGFPLLGAISRINTQETVRNARLRIWWIYTLTFFTGAAAIALAVTVSQYLK